MKAVVVESPGGIEALKYGDIEVPSISSGQVLVKNEFAGLNFIDTCERIVPSCSTIPCCLTAVSLVLSDHRSGLYKRDYPIVLGQEGGGTISKVNDEDKSKLAEAGLKVGDRVVYGAFGSYAEYTAVPIAKLVPIPDGIGMETALACTVQGLTAHYLSSSVGSGVARPGDWVLVYSVGSGTGQWTSKMCKLRGYKVIGTTSRNKIEGLSEADAAADFGCDHLIVLENVQGKSYADYESTDIVSRVKEITDNRGCKMIIDGVGKSTYQISLECLAKRGIFVSFGNASGAVPAFPVLKLTPQSAYVTRPKLNDYVATREELLERAGEVFDWVKKGELKISVDKTFNLKDVAEGHAYIEGGRSRGKILFKP